MNKNIRINKQIQPLYETAALLITGSDIDRTKAECIEQMNAMGLDGASFYKENLQGWEQYLRTFAEHRREPAEAGFFFGEKDEEWRLFLLSLVAESIVLGEKGRPLEAWSERDWIQLMIHLLAEEDGTTVPESTEEKIHFLSKQGRSSKMKWKTLLLLERPKEQMEALLQICQSNLPAYEAAQKTVQKELELLLAQCPDTVEPAYADMVKTFTDGVCEVFVSLATPMLLWAGVTVGVQGLLVDTLFRYSESQSRQKEWVQVQLKLLGDKSKFEILASLKEQPKYNLELAEQLHLTPATVSHHMSQLLNMDLVLVKKENGRVYYYCNTETLEQLLRRVQEYLV